jgi:hypothetical protein
MQFSTDDVQIEFHKLRSDSVYNTDVRNLDNETNEEADIDASDSQNVFLRSFVNRIVTWHSSCMHPHLHKRTSLTVPQDSELPLRGKTLKTLECTRDPIWSLANFPYIYFSYITSVFKTTDSISLHGWLGFPRWYELATIPWRHSIIFESLQQRSMDPERIKFGLFKGKRRQYAFGDNIWNTNSTEHRSGKYSWTMLLFNVHYASGNWALCRPSLSSSLSFYHRGKSPFGTPI